MNWVKRSTRRPSASRWTEALPVVAWATPWNRPSASTRACPCEPEDGRSSWTVELRKRRSGRNRYQPTPIASRATTTNPATTFVRDIGRLSARGEDSCSGPRRPLPLTMPRAGGGHGFFRPWARCPPDSILPRLPDSAAPRFWLSPCRRLLTLEPLRPDRPEWSGGLPSLAPIARNLASKERYCAEL